MQHITPNLKRWDYSDIPGGSHGQIKGPAHMVEGGHHPRNRPPTLGTTSVDFYHYPVTVWAYSTPQPNTEVPPPTGGASGQSSLCINVLELTCRTKFSFKGFQTMIYKEILVGLKTFLLVINVGLVLNREDCQR